jgi:hypothetical protein
MSKVHPPNWMVVPYGVVRDVDRDSVEVCDALLV